MALTVEEDRILTPHSEPHPQGQTRPSRLAPLGIQLAFPVPGADSGTLVTTPPFLRCGTADLGKGSQEIKPPEPLPNFDKLVRALVELGRFDHLRRIRQTNGNLLGETELENYFPTAGGAYLRWLQEISLAIGNNQEPRAKPNQPKIALLPPLPWESVQNSRITPGQTDWQRAREFVKQRYLGLLTETNLRELLETGPTYADVLVIIQNTAQRVALTSVLDMVTFSRRCPIAVSIKPGDQKTASPVEQIRQMAAVASLLEEKLTDRRRLFRVGQPKVNQTPFIVRQDRAERKLERNPGREILVIEFYLGEENPADRYKIHRVTQQEALGNLIAALPYRTDFGRA